jgi:hypothetical protein
LQGFARFFKKPCNLCEKYAQYRASIQNKVLFCRNEGAYQVRRNIKTLDFRLKTVYYLVNTIRKERLNSGKEYEKREVEFEKPENSKSKKNKQKKTKKNLQSS